MRNYHTPVMVAEVIDGLRVEAGKRFVDATLGGGGHTVEILRLGGRVLGIDADFDAVAYTKERLKMELPETKEGTDWRLEKGNFRDIERIAEAEGVTGVSGVLLDLGVSSRQLDSVAKGFSYRFLEAPLDMRFDREAGVAAADFVNSATEEELYEAITKFGEEERAGAIVHALVRARQIKKIQTAGDMVGAVKRAVGDNKETSGVLSRVFQALRIQTNDELSSLREGLEGARHILKPGGRLAVISFHSLEDRTVKQHMNGNGWKRITRRPLTATGSERDANSRSRSAKLRIAEKI